MFQNVEMIMIKKSKLLKKSLMILLSQLRSSLKKNQTQNHRKEN